MPSLAELLIVAARHYAAREFDLADQLAREIVSADAACADAACAEAWRLLGVIALQRNSPDQAIDFLNRSLACDGVNPETWLNAADFHRVAGNLPAALAHYEQSIALRPDHGVAHDRSGIVLYRLGRWPKAVAAFERAIALKPGDAEIACHLAECLREMGTPERAAAHYREALRLDPDQAVAARGLGFALMHLGSLEEAVVQLRASLERQPNQPQVYHSLSQLAVEGWCQLTADEIGRIQAIAGAAQVSPFDRSQCAFALAGVLEAQGSYDEAMAYFHLANDQKRRFLRGQGIHFDAQRHEAMIDRIIALFDQGYFERVQGWGVDSEAPIFVVGMPRSGSTLVEQVLASHPQVFGGGEFGDLRLFIQQFQPQASSDSYSVSVVKSRDESAHLAAEYLQWIRELDQSAARIVNKTLHNFLHLGAIATLFPRARIIHCRRDPLDTCLSCYTTNFKLVDFAWSLEDIAAYYCAYEKLIAHWARVLPLPVKVVSYEELVDNPKPTTMDLIASCGLEWDDRCLEFDKTRRVVKTASALQVRKPIHKRAVGRWQHYRAHLGPLFHGLGLPSSGPAEFFLKRSD
jgi:tetratricopeptide (TPR) repeat protein